MNRNKVLKSNAGLNTRKFTSLLLAAAMLFTVISFNTGHTQAAYVREFDLNWRAAFGDSGYDEAFSVVSVDKENEDDPTVEGYVFTGTYTDTAGLEYTYLVKTDKKGDTLWEKKYGGIFRASGRSVSQTRDGGFITAGTSKTYLESFDKVYIIKTDAEGNRQWEKKLSLEEQGYAYDKKQGFSIKEVEDGYIIAGEIIIKDSSDALIIKIDSLGTVQWAKRLGGPQWEWLYDIEPVSDGYIAAGSTEEDNRAYAYLVKVNAAGNVIWEHKWETPGCQLKDMIVTQDGNLAASGYCGEKLYFMKFTNSNTIPSYIYSNTYGEGIGYGLVQLANGDFIIAGNGKIIGIKKDGTLSWEKSLSSESSFVKSVTIGGSGAIVFAGNMSNGGSSDACLFEISADRASLGVSSTSVIKGKKVYFYSPLFKKSGELDKSGNTEVKVKIKNNGEESWVDLTDKDLTLTDDFVYLDGVYGGSSDIKLVGSDPVEVELYVDGIKEDTRSIKVIDDPDLLVLTDYKKLYEEFIDNDTALGEDKNGNNIPDFYDLMDRVCKYAEDHKGIVLDVSRELTTEKGWDNYTDRSYEYEADMKSVAIDALINQISQTASFSNVAIIGDDEVIPFYRRADPVIETGTNTTKEQEYVMNDLGNTYGNPTLRDSGTGKIMTDVPYGSYDNTHANYVPYPIPDAGVGRIFSDNPSTLINMINGYETPINMVPGKSKAAILGIDSDLIDHKSGVDFPKLSSWMAYLIQSKYKQQKEMLAGGSYDEGHFYWTDGATQKWGPSSLTKAISEANLIMVQSHANHFNQNTQGNPDIDCTTFASYLGKSPGKVFVNTGCHSGYSVSHNNELLPGESFRPYNRAMVNYIISRQVAYLAASTYGICSNDALISHELFYHKFIEAVINDDTGTIGGALKKAYPNYKTAYSGASDKYAEYGVYGIVFYGLPTQKIATTEAEPSALRTLAPDGPMALKTSEPAGPMEIKTSESAAGERSLMQLAKENRLIKASDIKLSGICRNMDITVDITEFKRTVNESGEVLYEIPGGSEYTKLSFAPLLPSIIKTYILPKGSTVNNVILKNKVQQQIAEQLQLKANTPIVRATGPEEGSFELTDTYPAEVFTWKQEQREDGSYLNVYINPIQYNPKSRQVTLYNKLELKVDYTIPEETAEISEITVNNGSSVAAGMAGVSANVKINSSTARTIQMNWVFRDNAGDIIESGSKTVDLVEGENLAAFNFDTTDWIAGMKDLTISLKDSSDNSLVASGFAVIPVTGLNLEIDMKNRIIDPADRILFSAEVRDEKGVGITGLTSDKFSVRIGDVPFQGAVMTETGGGIYSFEFPASLLSENIHRLSITCTDTENNGRSDTAEISFKVKTDTEPPVVSSAVPAKNAAGVSLDRNIVIQFDERVLPTDKFDDIRLFKSTSDGDIAVRIEKNLDYGILTIEPDENFEMDTIYKVLVPAEAVMDGKSNKIASQYSYKFITYAEADKTKPEVVSTQPAKVIQAAAVLQLPEIDFSNGLPADASILIRFSESIAAGAGAAKISWTADNMALAFDAAYYGTDLVLTPVKTDPTQVKPLPYNSKCKITLPAGSINDLSGNPLETEHSFEFTTEKGPDEKAPDIMRFVPEQGESGALTAVKINIIFDELILRGDKFHEIKLIGPSGSLIPYTAEVQRDTVTLKPGILFEYNKEYKVSVPAGAVKDLKGNGLLAAKEFKFTTGKPEDKTGPQVSEMVPADNSSGVLTGAAILVYYDETVLPGEHYGEITLKRLSGGDNAGDDDNASTGAGISVGMDTMIQGNALVITPATELGYSTVYRMIVPAGALKDLNENPTSADTIFEFTTQTGPDTVPPTLISTAPTSGAVNVPVNTSISFAFNEPLKKGGGFDDIRICGESGTPIPFDGSVNGRKLELTTTGLPLSTDITVTIPAGAIADLYGNTTIRNYNISFRTVTAAGGGDGESPGGGTPGDGSGGSTPGSGNGGTGNTTGGGIGGAGGIGDGNPPIVIIGDLEDPEQGEGGESFIPVNVDDDLINQQLQDQNNNPVISILIPGSAQNTGNFSFQGITGQTVKNMELKGATLQVNTGLAGYSIPASLFNIDDIAEDFGGNVDLSEIKVSIRISAADDDMLEIINNSAEEGDFSNVLPPVNISIECSYGDRKIEINSFRKPVTSAVPIPEGVDPEDITTAVMIQEDGTVLHAPTKVIEVDGKFYAQVTSFSNGTFAFVTNRAEFSDAENHWAGEFINELGSRFITSGAGGDTFKPDNEMTRAEMVVMLVRALGIRSSGGSGRFTDVGENKWYSEAVTAAGEYGLVHGYQDQTFKPLRKITWEEALAMITRAMKLVGVNSSITSIETQQLLESIANAGGLSEWAHYEVAFAIKYELPLGLEERLIPDKNITRAEAAVLIVRMLRKAGLIGE